MNISVFHLEAVCNVFVGQLTVIGIDCGVHSWIFVAGSFQTIFCKQQTIAQSCIVSAMVDVLGTAPGIFPTQ